MRLFRKKYFSIFLHFPIVCVCVGGGVVVLFLSSFFFFLPAVYKKMEGLHKQQEIKGAGMDFSLKVYCCLSITLLVLFP